jgi:Zn-dependent alcohol dehydrogenase
MATNLSFLTMPEHMALSDTHDCGRCCTTTSSKMRYCYSLTSRDATISVRDGVEDLKGILVGN